MTQSKSTVVCALYILFDGHVRNLGRQETLGQFINNERTNNPAKLTVVLKQKNDQHIRIRKSWSAGKREGKWEIKESTDPRNVWKTVSKDHVQSIIRSFNINGIYAANLISDQIEQIFFIFV